MASHDKGGLDIGSLHDFNCGLLFKWIWRFVSQPHALWVSVIQGDGPLKHKYGRLFHSDSNANCLLAERCNDEGWTWSWTREIRPRNQVMLSTLQSDIGSISLSQGTDSWQWCLQNNSGFAVCDTRAYIDDRLLPSIEPSTRWMKVLPRKINIFLWRLALDRLPTRQNLTQGGIDIEDSSCISCDHTLESSQHVFFDCGIAEDLWRQVRIWLDIPMPPFCKLV
ncbi:uncharacterized protein [Rutidosis leptorrhynchoides]|uniref:uncharacterized protein n=1 Tax=Rutidosis leptorrhynchoides TaxID=125765 RepID=UPI003A99379C